MINNYKQSVPINIVGVWTDIDIAIYCHFKSQDYCNKTYSSVSVFNRQALCYSIYGELCSQHYLNQISKSLKKLEQLNIIKAIDNSNYVFANDIDKGEHFVLIEMSILNQIMQMKTEGLLSCYLLLINSLNYKTILDGRHNVIGFMPQSYFADQLFVANSTISDWESKLEAAQLIYIYHVAYNQGTNNIYCKYEDKELAIKYAKDNNIRKKAYDYTDHLTRREYNNRQRSLTQKYNALCRGKTYDEETLQEIYQYILEYNAEHPDEPKDVKPLIIQLSVGRQAN